MGFDKETLEVQLDNLWGNKAKNVKTLHSKNKKYVIISDMHMGNGDKADDFRKNKNAVVRALNYYKKEGYELILLGDIEELWQFTADEVANTYGDSVYESIRAFGDDKLYRVFGNHDLDWKTKDPIRSKSSLSYEVFEGIKLTDANGVPKLLLVHGHQGTKDSDKYSFLSRAAVMLYRYIEPYLKLDKSEAAPQSPIMKSFEKERYEWAKKKEIILMCGHTHQAVFNSRSKIDLNRKKIKEVENEFASLAVIGQERFNLLKKIEILNEEISEERSRGREYDPVDSNPAPHYFNSGCALYKDGITVIEIASNRIKLVKWHRKARSGNQFAVYEEESLSDIINRLG
jgi:UDP-2,3-diacylglucosamine pyrophosphatase LpxH